ncbi:hypothetical protein CcrC1_gp425 [Caulobacter phage C1]|nr:hypothetical protein CcrC1_gp425 [Caulobacter phage C1]UTU08654.1 hypothetical protein CcrC2_gp426 [Caulobacter phage C2]UTU09167.1 hypothetical protein CcrJ4_gp420 [Caulobacter phage J4]UTU10286.1 hypothetical protein CcrRB23_gp424 [Caulobacter phage RB23]WGN97320.1 hypothetical protein [Bertelyvirus sp.]
MSDTFKKYDGVVDRLSKKIGYSQSRVPGFIIGLSGTDSIVAFDALYSAMQNHWREERMLGIHYVDRVDKSNGSFDTIAIPWMREKYPKATFLVAEPLGGNHDQQRWADLHSRALHTFHADGGRSPLPPEETYWIAGAMNATEAALGKYTILANAVSIQPIRSLWKAEVLEISEKLGVPAKIIANSRIPDCLCGRDDLAAENIELIDDILRARYDPTQHDVVLLKKLLEYVRINQEDNGFRTRIPYRV